MVIMDPYEAEALMIFIAMVSCKLFSVMVDTLIDTAVSLNFAIKVFAMAYGSNKDCKIVPKLSIPMASEQRISITSCFLLRFSPLIDTNSVTYNLEFFSSLKVQIFSVDYRL